MKALQRALAPLEVWLIRQMPETVHAVAKDSRPAFMAAATTLMRWPDRTQAKGYVEGMRILDDIQHTGIFRELPFAKRRSKEGAPSYFGESAEIRLQELLKSKPPKDFKLIYDETVGDQSKGWLSQFYTAADLDRMFGKGQWQF